MIGETLYRHEKWIAPAVWTICIFLLAVPAGKTIRSAFHYFDLRSKTSGKEMVFRIRKSIPRRDSVSNVFEALSVSCRRNGAVVRQVDVPKTEINGKLEIVHQQITIGGGFVPVLKSLNDLSQDLSGAKIGSIGFDRHEVNRTDELLTTVIFEQVKLTANDEK